MASVLEVKLVAKVDERERREATMLATLERIRDMNLGSSRAVLVRQCVQWLEAHEECNELARALCDAADAERVVVLPVETFHGKAIAV